MACLDDLTVANLFGDGLPGELRAEALTHVDQCRSCCELVADLLCARSPERPAEARDRLLPGTVVGRYVVERAVGAGAMGVVYAARDPKLGRLVALKLMTASSDRTTTERIVREAQAMAQLSHPNVIAIFDVGTVAEDVFLAMEYLPGRTLRRWLDDRGRHRRELITTLVAAGTGLAAAHAVGIVHRDVKPENILVSERGRVCVTDFGLARAVADGARAPIAAETSAVELTQTGQLVGTPVYMAPEQLAGEPADARSDQFAFCVVLYEALYGERPFAGRTIAELRGAIARGLPPEPRTRRVPARLRRIIARGLAPDPTARFASIEALLAVLARDPAVRRRRIAATAGLALAATAVGLALARPSHAPAACPSPRDRLAGTWDAARRAQMKPAFLLRARPYAAVMFEHAAAALDHYADDWVAMRLEVCRATYVRHDQSEARYDAELTCLERRRSELGAAAELLVAAPDDQTVQKAVAVAQGLTSLAACRDGAVLAGMTPMPADPFARAQIDAIYQGIATARTLSRAAKYRAAAALARELVARARRAGFGPALAEALFVVGTLEDALGDPAAAERALYEAAELAAAVKDDALLARSWCSLTAVLGTTAGQYPEASSLARVARTAIQRVGDPAPLVIEWHTAVASALLAQEKFEESVAHSRDAATLAERTFAPDSRKVADALSRLAAGLIGAGHPEAARAPTARALAISEANLGPDHPDLAFPLIIQGGLLFDLGDQPAAERSYRRAVAIFDHIGEPPTYDSAEAIEGLANTESALGALDEARRDHERALAIRLAIGGADDPRVADSHVNLGIVLLAQGKVGEAREHIERGLALYRAAYGPDRPLVAGARRELALLEIGTPAAVRDAEAALATHQKTLGPDHRDVGLGLAVVGAAYAGIGRWAEAQDRYERALAHHEKAVGAVHWMTGAALAGLGECLIERGDSRRAVAVLERALEIFQATHALPGVLGSAHYDLARALWNTGADRRRARQLAAQSRSELAGLRDPRSLKVRAAAERWLATHP